MKVFELEGFNGKARVIEENGVSKLFSYETHVADYDHSNNEMKVYGWFSSTTGRHINSFLEFYGFEKCTKKELFNLYNLKK
jgi:hypothetical protein